VLEQELSEALGTACYERSEGRRGYRNGHGTRRVTTCIGIRELEIPRGRIVQDDGNTREFRTQILPATSGARGRLTRRAWGRTSREPTRGALACALSPLLGEEHLSNSVVSRVAARLKVQFAEWSERDLSGERYAIVFHLGGLDLYPEAFESAHTKA